MIWKQEKPSWCPHEDCIFLRRVQDALCAGKLPKPEPHGGDFNTHRMCMTEVLPNGEVFDLQVNKTDAYHFRRILRVIEGEEEGINPREVISMELIQEVDIMNYGHIHSYTPIYGVHIKLKDGRQFVTRMNFVEVTDPKGR